METNELLKVAEQEKIQYVCELCYYNTSRSSSYTKHLATKKHQNKTFGDFGNEKDAKSCNYSCLNCKKQFMTRNGLWKHKKTCQTVPPEKEKDNLINILLKENTDFKNIIIDVIKNNSNLQKQFTDLQQQVVDVCKNNLGFNHNTINNNNSHNKTFNLQFFLNEQCKDAMNIMDFVNSVTLQLSDLESVGKLGYVEGISNIMIKKLTEMDIYKRPVHCSDAKRETLYVKDNDIWEKENASHSKLRKAIKYISKKNSDLLLTWSNQHPASKNIHSKQNEEYMKMIYQAMGGVGDVEENENKIIKKISKMMLIDK